MRSRSTLLTLPVLVALAVVAVACSGGGSDRVRFDPANADALAHAALISETDLPREGWTVVATDEFEDDTSSDFAGLSAECQTLEADSKALTATLAPQRAGRAQKEFERQAPNYSFPVSVDVEVQILSDDAHLAAALATLRDLFGSYVDCLGEYFAGQLGDPDATVTASAVTPLASPPQGGAVLAMEIEFETGGVKGILRFENYAWTYANATVSVAISGPQEAFTAELVTTAVAGMDEAVIAAAVAPDN